MNRSELVKRVSDETGFTQKDVKSVVESMLKTVCDGLSEDGKVTLTGFGNFTVKERKSRKGRNPQTGEDLVIPAKLVTKFKPGKLLEEAALNYDPHLFEDEDELEDEE